jgi:hypothetical protein
MRSDREGERDARRYGNKTHYFREHCAFGTAAAAGEQGSVVTDPGIGIQRSDSLALFCG